MTDWIMIAITFVYVVATIFISYFNYRSAKATKEMLMESRRQYDEINRPWISVELIYAKRSFYAIRFTNYGKLPAYHVRFNLHQSFIDSIKEDNIRTLLEKQKGRERVINAGQHYDLFFGTNRYTKNSENKPACGTVTYEYESKQFEEHFEIDVGNYPTFFSVNSEMEDLIKRIDKQNIALNRIANSLDRMNSLSIERQEEKND